MTEITFPTNIGGCAKVRYALRQMRGNEFTNDDRKVLFGALLNDEVSTEEEAIVLIEQFFVII